MEIKKDISKNPLLKAVLFDHDGTIVDSEEVHLEVWREVLKPFDVTITHKEWITKFTGIPGYISSKRIIEENKLDIQPDELYALKFESTKSYLKCNSFPLIDGVREIMQALHNSDVRIGVVSGADRASVMASIEAHGLDKWVEVVVTGDDVDHSKPAPDVYLKAMSILNLKPENCIAIEDSEAGIASSVAAGITCFAMRTEYTEQHDRSKASMVFDNFNSLSSWLFDSMR